MDICPGCGSPLASPDDICPRCALAQAIPPSVPARPVDAADGNRFRERRELAGPDRDIGWSLRMLLLVGVGIVLLLFAVTAILVWFAFGP